MAEDMHFKAIQNVGVQSLSAATLKDKIPKIAVKG